MQTFVIPDMHGHPDALRALLLKAGVINGNGDRVLAHEDWLSEFQVVSIGDLLNGTLKDMDGDTESLMLADKWIDKLILGNHEAEYVFPRLGMNFSGSHLAPHIVSAYNAQYRAGKVVPCVLVGDTLLSHAGVMEYFDFETAAEAAEAITDVWGRLRELCFELEEYFRFRFQGQEVQVPKETLITAVSSKRGGSTPYGGILWSDWSEGKNSNFSQIVGHTPIPTGPERIEHMGLGTFTLNIDCSAKTGAPPVGVWLDEQGTVMEFVHV